MKEKKNFLLHFHPKVSSLKLNSNKIKAISIYKPQKERIMSGTGLANCVSMRLFSSSSRVMRISRKELMDKTRLLKEFRQFLGPRSITGDYHKNKYYYPTQNNKPNYIVNDGKSVVGESPKLGQPSRLRNVDVPGRDPHLHPFPHNIYTKTAYMIPEHLKLQIVEDEQVNGLHPQEIAHKYGINLQRVEAILKLSAIEKNFQPKVCYKNNNELLHSSYKLYS